MRYADIEAAWRSGRIDSSTLVWRETMADWTPISAVPLLSMGLPARQQPKSPSQAEPSEPPASRPSPPTGDPHSLDFAAAKRRRRSSMSGAPGSKPSSKPSPKPTSATATARSPGATPTSPHPVPGSPGDPPFSANASLAALTMHAIAMVDPQSDDEERPSSPWSRGSVRSEAPAQSTSSPAADPATAAPDTAEVVDASFEKDFEELWAGGLDPKPAERAAPNPTPVATDPNFEEDFAELWAQGPQPASDVTGGERPAPAARDQTTQAPAETEEEPPAAEQVLRAVAPEADIGGTEREPTTESTASGAPPEEASRHAPTQAQSPSSDDVQVSGEREAMIPPSEPKPRSAPSLDSLRDLRLAPPREPSHSTPAPLPPQPSTLAAPDGWGRAAAPNQGPPPAQAPRAASTQERSRPSTIQPSMRPPPPRSAAARLAAVSTPDAASLEKGAPHRPSLPAPSRPSVPTDASLSRAPSAASSPLASSPSGPSSPRPSAVATDDSRPFAVFSRPSATLVFGEPQPAAPAKHGPPPLPAARSSAAATSPGPAAALAPSSTTASPNPAAAPAAPSSTTASPNYATTPSPSSTPVSPSAAPAPSLANATASATPGAAPSPSGVPAIPNATLSPPVSSVSPSYEEQDFAAALRRGSRWSVRALPTGAGGPWASLRGNGRLSRKAVIGVAAGAVFILAFVLSLAHSSKDSTESASAQEEPPSPAKSATAAPPHVPSPTASSVSAEGERAAQEPPPQSALSRAMRKALTGAPRTGSSRRGESDRVAAAAHKPGLAPPKDGVGETKTTKPPVTVARRPQSRPASPGSNIPPPSFTADDSAPKKTAWDPTNPGF
jgi:hypothetical protein